MLAEPTIHKAGNQLHVTHGEDSNLYVEFHNEAVLQEFESEQSGRPVYKNVPYITIMFPGDNTKKVVRPVKLRGDESSPSDIDRFARQWERFQKQEEQVQEGIPLEQWPQLTKADVMSFKSSGIHTVEALASVGDHNIEKLGLGARKFRDKAKAYLDSANGIEVVAKLQAENTSLKADIEALKTQIAEIGKIKSRKGQDNGLSN